jgi:N-acetylglucosamine malate deacetylase 2
MKKLLFVYAHPDDESFVSGGTIAKYIKAGCKVNLVCATRGENGKRGIYQDTEDALGDIREKELRKVAEFLHTSAPVFLGYKDGGVSGLVPGELEAKLITILTELQPDIVVTFEPMGYTNHPDHIAVSLSTTFAFQKYAFDRSEIDPDDQHPPKLYYACIPKSVASYLLDKKVIPTESFGRPWRAVEDKFVSTVIDIKTYAKKKMDALKLHGSQALDVLRFYSIPTNPLAKQEYFVLRMVGVKEAFFGKNDRVTSKL